MATVLEVPRDATEAATFAATLEQVTPKASRAEQPGLLRAIGALYFRKCVSMDEAEAAFRRLRKSAPFDPWVVDFYVQVHEERGETPQLVALLGQALRKEREPGRRLALAERLAHLSSADPKAVEKAIDAWKQVLKLRRGHAEAIRELRRLYEETSKWNALLELLKDQLDTLPASDVEGRIALMLETVPIYRDRMQLDVMVTNTYGAILKLDPKHPEALAALATRYEKQKRWHDLARLRLQEAEGAEDKGPKIEALLKAAEIFKRSCPSPRGRPTP